MDIVARAKGLILRPRKEWAAIAFEPTDTRALFTGYAMPVSAVPAVAGFIGSAIFGAMLGSVTGGAMRVGIPGLLISSLLGWVLGLVSVFVIGRIIEALAPRFGAPADPLAAMKLAVYAPTAAWLAGVFAILPPLALLSVLGLYSLYLFHVGAPIVARVPQDRALVFTAAVVAVAILVNLLIAVLLGGLFL